MNTLTIIRHLAAVAAAWLTTTLVGALGLDVGPEQVAEVQGALTTLGATLLLALYAALEKLLKPLFHRLGEPRAAEVDLEGLDPTVLAALAGRKPFYSESVPALLKRYPPD
jgi:hypothetical protein